MSRAAWFLAGVVTVISAREAAFRATQVAEHHLELARLRNARVAMGARS